MPPTRAMRNGTARECWQRGQRGAQGHGRRQHAHLPVQVEAYEVDPERRRCPACGDEYHAHGSEDSEQVEIEVRAYRRVIKRQRYRRSCQCEGAPRLRTAPAPARLIPKGILGISVWVTVLIDKYLLYRPTYRLLADLRAHGLDLARAPGSIPRPGPQNRTVILNPTPCSGSAPAPDPGSLALSRRRASRENSSDPMSPRRRSRTNRQARL